MLEYLECFEVEWKQSTDTAEAVAEEEPDVPQGGGGGGHGAPHGEVTSRAIMCLEVPRSRGTPKLYTCYLNILCKFTWRRRSRRGTVIIDIDLCHGLPLVLVLDCVIGRVHCVFQ
eukprot:TRINITY_DN29449_c0_g1_i1.p1 TRINITY_DN29449_c0_g1~~TRINITY_DN29449_c0_g1_i1.p1  ORF type:complete len:115 (+),score=14.42 TRINITY_DN29449_c0_g1_i1:281-625(+)